MYVTTVSDYKTNISIQAHQTDWEKGKNKFREKNSRKSGLKEENQKKHFIVNCNRVEKNSKNDDCKIKNETIKEKKKEEILENSHTPWTSCYTNWSNKTDDSGIFEYYKRNERSNSEKAVADTLTELKEKVEFLFNFFKNCNPKLFNDTHGKEALPEFSEIMTGDFWHLININQRLSMAEKAIQKLCLILEDLLKDTYEKKACSSKENVFSEPLNFEEMTITQRINLLKNRNDFLFNFMKDFLKVRSVGESYTAMDLLQRDYKLNQNSWNTAFRITEDNGPNLNSEDVLETLKELKLQFSDGNIKTSHSFCEDYLYKHERKGETGAKNYKNKLEVISEQLELDYSLEAEEETSKDLKHNNNELSLKKKISEIQQKFKKKDLGISEKTARLLAQEAKLKSSIDKANLEILSHQGFFEENTSSTKNHQLTTIVETNLDEKMNKENFKTICDPLRPCTYRESKSAEKPKTDIKKNRSHDKKKKEINAESTSSHLPKPQMISSKKSTKHSDAKNQIPPKVFSPKTRTLLLPALKIKQHDDHLREVCSASREESKKESGTKNQRPMTTPGLNYKPSPTAGVKTLVSEKNRKKYSGINNVKNRNKLLISQKSCVQTA